MAGLVRLVPAIPDCGGTALCIGIAGTSPAMTSLDGSMPLEHALIPTSDPGSDFGGPSRSRPARIVISHVGLLVRFRCKQATLHFHAVTFIFINRLL
jgi:hypothetical protein